MARDKFAPESWESIESTLRRTGSPESEILEARQFYLQSYLPQFGEEAFTRQKDTMKTAAMEKVKSQAAQSGLKIGTYTDPSAKDVPGRGAHVGLGGTYDVVRPDTNRLFDAWRGGASTSIPGAVANRLSGGGAQDFIPEGIGEGLVYGGSALVSSLPEFAAASALIPATAGGSGAAFLASKAPTIHKVASALSKVGKPVANPILRMGAIGGAQAATNEAIAGSLNRGQVDPGQIAKRGAIGTVLQGGGRAANLAVVKGMGGKAVKDIPISQMEQSLSKVGGGAKFSGGAAEVSTFGVGGPLLEAGRMPNAEEFLMAAGPMAAPMVLGAIASRGRAKVGTASQEAPRPAAAEPTIQPNDPTSYPYDFLIQGRQLAHQRFVDAQAKGDFATMRHAADEFDSIDRELMRRHLASDDPQFLEAVADARPEPYPSTRAPRPVTAPPPRPTSGEAAPAQPTVAPVEPPPAPPQRPVSDDWRQASAVNRSADPFSGVTAEGTRKRIQAALDSGDLIWKADPTFPTRGAWHFRGGPAMDAARSAVYPNARRGGLLASESRVNNPENARAAAEAERTALTLSGVREQMREIEAAINDGRIAEADIPAAIEQIATLSDIEARLLGSLEYGTGPRATSPDQIAYLSEGEPGLMGGTPETFSAVRGVPNREAFLASEGIQPMAGEGVAFTGDAPAGQAPTLEPPMPGNRQFTTGDAAPQPTAQQQQAVSEPYKVDPRTGRQYFHYINQAKQNVPAEYHQHLDGLMAQAVAEGGGDPRIPVSGNQIAAEAAGVTPEFLDGITLGPRENLPAPVAYAMKGLLNQLGADHHKVTRSLESNRLTDPERDALMRQADVLEQSIKRTFDTLSQSRSNAGRNLYFERLMANQTFDTDYWLNRARRASGGALRDEDMKMVTRWTQLGQEAQAKGDMQGVETAKREIAKTQAKLDRNTPAKVIFDFWRAGLLSGIKTHMRNISGNTMFQAAEEMARIPASYADILLSVATGNERQVAGASTQSVGRAVRESIGGFDDSGKWQWGKGAKEAKDIFTGKAKADAEAGIDQYKEFDASVILGEGKAGEITNAYVNTVFRGLQAEDKIFRTYAYKRSLDAQARLDGVRKGLSGEELEAHVERYKPSAADEAEALAYAEFATFNNRNAVSTAIEGGRATLRARGAGGLATISEFTMPFNRTPVNIAGRILDYAAIGGLYRGATSKRSREAMHQLMTGEKGKRWQGFKEEFTKSLSPEEQRAIANAFGRGAVGVGTIAIGYALASRGLMTGTYQSTPGEKGREQILDRPAGAILLGGQWHVVGPMSPIGNLLAIGATIHREGKKLGGGTIPAMALKTVLDQPYLQGVQQITDIGHSQNIGQAVNRLAANYGRSVVPRIVQDIGGVAEAVGQGNDQIGIPQAEGLLQGVQSGIPFARQNLPAKIDPFGRPITMSALGNLANPAISRPDRRETDPVAREIDRLNSTLKQQSGASLGLTKPSDKEKGAEIPPEIYRAFARSAGNAAMSELLRVVRSGDYRRLRSKPEEQAKMLRSAISEARKGSREKMREASR